MIGYTLPIDLNNSRITSSLFLAVIDDFVHKYMMHGREEMSK